MTLSPHDSDRRRRDPLGFDEWIAILIAFGTIGSILWWGMRSTGRWAGFSTATATPQFSGQILPGTTTTPEGFSATLPTVTATPAAGAGEFALGNAPAVSGPSAPSPAIGSPNFVGPTLPATKPWRFGIAAGMAGAAGVAGTAAGAIAQPTVTAEPTPIIAPTAAITEAAPSPEVPQLLEAIPATPITPVALPTAAPPPTSVPVGKAIFTDVAQESWVVPFIKPLAGNKLVEGNPDGTFQPDQPVTRAEFAMMLSQALNAQGDPTDIQKFKDIDVKAAVAQDISGAIKTQFMRGYSATEFRPNQQIPRYQVLVALATGLGLAKPGDPAAVLQRFSDVQTLPKWAEAQVASATTANLVISPTNLAQLEPDRPATRAEAIAMIHQMLVNQGKLKPVESKAIVKP